MKNKRSFSMSRFLYVCQDTQLGVIVKKDDTIKDKIKKDLFGICPFATTQKILSGKWSIYILFLLSEGPVRFNELKRRLPEEMTHATLSRQLKQLEEEGLIIRHEYVQVPPKVEYYMSDIGEKFKIVLEALEIWGKEYIKHITQKENK